MIGPMPHWDVDKVTDMSEAFKDKNTFNADRIGTFRALKICLQLMEPRLSIKTSLNGTLRALRICK